MTGATTPYRSALPTGRDGFAQLLRSEWTKFRTVRGWVAGTIVAALIMVLVGLLTAEGSHSSCAGPPGATCSHLLGPDGEAVDDRFYFAHQTLEGDGSITVRITSLTGLITYPPPCHCAIVPGVVPWAKAGIIIKESTKQGAAYAAVMVTGSHGVRMQYDYTHDTAGSPGSVSAASPRWLRLTRSGDTLTGYESADDTRWTKVGTAHLAGLPATVQAGLFVASPQDVEVTPGIAGGFTGRLTQATATFDDVSLEGSGPAGVWSHDVIGGQGGQAVDLGGFGFKESGRTFIISGTGDIAPLELGGRPIERTLSGTFAALIVVIVVGAMFITAEYRRGMIRTTLAASPRRGRVLAAKAVVLGSVTFVAGLAGAAVTIPLGEWVLRANGNYIFPVTSLTELRVVAGTAALLAVAAVLALAVGTILRGSAAAVTAVIVAIVLPYLLATGAPLPEGVSQWLLRLTPAAAFAIQQSLPQYPQVVAAYTALNGFYPLASWAGFAVLCAYTALALGLAVFMLRRRDA